MKVLPVEALPLQQTAQHAKRYCFTYCLNRTIIENRQMNKRIKTGGRIKGTPNKINSETKHLINEALKKEKELKEEVPFHNKQLKEGINAVSNQSKM